MKKAAADYNQVITIGYCGDRAKNRGLEQAIEMLKTKYPGAEVVAVQIDPTKPTGTKLEAFHIGGLS